jgi:subtilase family serine protease
MQRVPSPLVFTDCTFEQVSGGFKSNATIMNVSNAAIAFSVGQIIARSTGPAGAYNHAAAGGGQYFYPNGTLLLTRQLGTLPAGQHNVVWEADPNNLHSMAGMANKSRACTLTVQAQAQPDLIVSDITIAPANPTPATVLSITILVKNLGPAPTTGSVDQIPNCFIDGAPFSGPTYQNAPNLPIQPGQAFSYLRTRHAGMTPGTHTIACTADRSNMVPEANETNNTLTRTFVIAQ